MKIVDEIEVHKANIISSCKVMAGRSKEMIAELEALKSCAEGKACGASDSKAERDSEKAAKATKVESDATGSSVSEESATSANVESSATGAADESPESPKTMNSVFDEQVTKAEQ